VCPWEGRLEGLLTAFANEAAQRERDVVGLLEAFAGGEE
jgi:hypothetical protein